MFDQHSANRTVGDSIIEVESVINIVVRDAAKKAVAFPTSKFRSKAICIVEARIRIVRGDSETNLVVPRPVARVEILA